MNGARKLRPVWKTVLIVLGVIVAIYAVAFLAQRVVSPAVARANESNGYYRGPTHGRIAVKRTKAPIAHKSAAWCYTFNAVHQVDSTPFGIDIGMLFKGWMWQTACGSSHSRYGSYIYYWNATGYAAAMGSLGEAFGWEYDGQNLAAAVGPKIIGKSTCFGCLVVKRQLVFTDWLSIPTGRINNGTYRMGLWITIWPDGSAWMGWVQQ